MKKYIISAIALFLTLTLTACGSSNNSGGDSNGAINAITRESGSGTRGAFVEIVGVVDEKGNDLTGQSLVVQDGTGKVLETVSGDKSAIGYISLGSLNDKVKALKVDGIEGNPENVLNGSYKIQRPLNIAYKPGSLKPLAEDFVKFIMSSDGQKIAKEHGFVPVDSNSKPYEKANVEKGEINISGSTSVGPLVKAQAEAYEKLHDGVKIVVNETGSSAGIKDAIAGTVDFGMASRELKDKEKKDVEGKAIAKDGIVVIVNKDNPLNDISLENVKSIYLEKIKEWKEVK